MASGSDIVGGAAAGAQILPALFGRGKSQYNAQDISHSEMYDPGAYQFGQYGADKYAYGKQQQASAIDQRTAPQSQFQQANYQQADEDRRRALEARGAQSTVMNGLMARAAGQTPSIAGMQARQDMGRAAAAQGSMAASARGPAGIAIAQQTAANNTANAQSRISNQAQINAANERLQAEQAAFGAASGMRGQDYGAQAGMQAQAQYDAGARNQSNQFNTGMRLNSRQVNDARAMGYEQMGHQALGAEQQGAVQMQGIAAQSHGNAQATNARTEGQNAQNKGLIETVGDFFSDVSTKMPVHMTSDFNAKQPFAGTPLPGLMGGGGMTTSGMGGMQSPMAGPAPASFDVLTAGGGGMDPMASLQKHSDFATQFQSDPTGGMGGSMISDARAKREAFEEGAKYADAANAGVQIKPPAYAVEKDGPRKPQIGAHITDAARGATGADAQRMRDIAVQAGANLAMSPAAAPNVIASGPAADAVAAAAQRRPDPTVRQDFTNAAKSVGVALMPVAGTAAEYITSDFTAKDPLKGGPSWTDQRTWGSKNKSAPKAEEEMAPGTDDFERTEPKEKPEGATKPWWEVLGNAGKNLNEAQFGGVRSDERAKNIIDIDDPKSMSNLRPDETASLQKWADRDPERFDNWADRQGWSKEPDYGPAREEARRTNMRDGSSDSRTNNFDKSFRRDTPADQKRVKRGVEDKAGRDADAMMANMRASMGKGSAVDGRIADSLKPSSSPVAEANRTMRGEMYTYKPQFTPPEQKPGEPNFGFMAQNLERSPITATAVKEDPNGLKRVDALKLLRVLGASVADLQEQQDETRLALKGGKKKK
jgi:hypothetical protein